MLYCIYKKENGPGETEMTLRRETKSEIQTAAVNVQPEPCWSPKMIERFGKYFPIAESRRKVVDRIRPRRVVDRDRWLADRIRARRTTRRAA
jgi:hypothetical protein